MSNLNVGSVSATQSVTAISERRSMGKNTDGQNFVDTMTEKSGGKLNSDIMKNVGVDEAVIAQNEGNKQALHAEEMKSAPIDFLMKALKEANIEPTESNMAIIKSLVKANLPLTEQNMTRLTQISTVFKGISTDTAALMLKFDIPVTTQNIAQFESVLSQRENLSDKITNLINNLPEGIAENSSSLKQLAESAIKLIELAQSEQTMVKAAQPQNQEPAAVQQGQGKTEPPAVLQKSEMRTLLAVLKDLGAKDFALVKLIHLNEPSLTRQSQAVPTESSKAEDFLSVIKDIMREIADEGGRSNRNNPSGASDVKFEKLKEFISGDIFGKLFKESAEDKWLIKPRELNSGELGKLYDGINKSIIRLDEGLNNLKQQFLGDMTAIKGSLNILNELNKTMPYLQIPIKFTDQTAESELYVFQNRKKRSGADKNHINILLRLELDNIGKLDIYVNMAGKDIRTRFYAEKEAALREIDSNSAGLQEKVNELGFNFTSVVSRNEKGFDFIDDFLNRGIKNADFTNKPTRFIV